MLRHEDELKKQCRLEHLCLDVIRQCKMACNPWKAYNDFLKQLETHMTLHVDKPTSDPDEEETPEPDP